MLAWLINFYLRAGLAEPCPILLEDGTLELRLEDDSGFIALESCLPAGAAAVTRRVFNPLLASAGRMMGRT